MPTAVYLPLLLKSTGADSTLQQLRGRTNPLIHSYVTSVDWGSVPMFMHAWRIRHQLWTSPCSDCPCQSPYPGEASSATEEGKQLTKQVPLQQLAGEGGRPVHTRIVIHWFCKNFKVCGDGECKNCKNTQSNALLAYGLCIITNKDIPGTTTARAKSIWKFHSHILLKAMPTQHL